ncbi:hypothetical protein BJX65DRAFT_27319 [Aspergillus insuetus]
MNQSPLSDRESGEERKVRVSRPKVRTGCVICKSRHKKCDEGQPSCLMCIRSGRVCEYRETVDRRRRRPSIDHHLDHSRSIVTVAPASCTNLDADERRYLDFFRQTTAAQCAGYLYEEFWQRLIHQVSEAEPAVCHAVIALGALHYRFLQLRMGAVAHSFRALDPTFSVQQCNKAIGCLRQMLMADRSSRHSTEVALVTCISLVSTLLFLEDAQWAGHHLRSGLKLLGEYTSDNRDQSSVSLTIQQAFAGLHLGWLAFSAPEAVIVDDPFSSLVPTTVVAEPSRDIATVGNSVIALARRVLCEGHSLCTEEVDTLFRELCGWQRTIKQCAIALQGSSPQRDRAALMLLELWSEVLYIILGVEKQSVSQPRETRYDAFLAHFQHMVELAKRLLLTTASRQEGSMPTFSVNVGVNAPLFFCGFKCREWLVRQEALLLLRRWRRQEGIWSTDGTTRILARVIEIESEGLGAEDVIPLPARIESVHVEFSEAGSGLCLWYRRAGDENWTTEWVR